MGLINMVETIKKIHVKEIVIVKIGKFYSVYGKDAYILSYIFKYKLRSLEKNIQTVGFPESSINKVISILEQNKIVSDQ